MVRGGWVGDRWRRLGGASGWGVAGGEGKWAARVKDGSSIGVAGAAVGEGQWVAARAVLEPCHASVRGAGALLPSLQRRMLTHSGTSHREQAGAAARLHVLEDGAQNSRGSGVARDEDLMGAPRTARHKREPTRREPLARRTALLPCRPTPPAALAARAVG